VVLIVWPVGVRLTLALTVCAPLAPVVKSTPARRIADVALMTAKPTTTTPRARSMATFFVPLSSVGTPATANRAGAVPMAKVAIMAPALLGDPVENA